MKVGIPYIIAAYAAAFLLQTTFFDLLKFSDVSVNLVLCTMIVLNCYSSSPAVYAGALICGLLIDLCLGYYIGVSALAYLVVSFAMTHTANLVYKNHFFSATYTALWATVLYEFIYWTILLVFGVNYSFAYMLGGLPIAMALNGVVSGVLKWIKG